MSLLDAFGSPDVVYMPAWEGGTKTTTPAICSGCRSRRRAWRCASSRSTRTPACPARFFRVMAPLPGNGPSKRRPTSWRERRDQRRICFGFPSQWKTWLGLTPFVLLHLLRDGGSHLQCVDLARTAPPPHAWRPLYERRGFLSWQVFIESTHAFRQ